jgi:DNA-directed RNA polymerase
MYNTFEVLNYDEFNSYIPIRLDGTCNGFQHLALLTDESDLYAKLNLVSSPAKEPNDFYNYIIHEVGSKIESMLRKGIEVDVNGRDIDKINVPEGESNVVVKKTNKYKKGSYGSYLRLSKVL